MKILNVAEKNNAAKNIANHLGGGNVRRRSGISPCNQIYEFNYNVRGQNAQMVMTSVSGHMLALDFTGQYRKWRGCNPLSLFDAPVVKFCPEDSEKIKQQIEQEVQSCQMLIIWTDCDREGENIGFEIIETCLAVEANLQVFRAKFSEITAPSIRRAINNLKAPNKLLSDAVSVRSELDLRIGAAFTRFQTLHLQKVFPQKLGRYLISYGSCQFPTLGFVVERYKSILRFIPEQFWKLDVGHTIDDLTVQFSWKRVRLFDELACEVLLDTVQERSEAVVEKVLSKPKSKWRPVPLDTIELEKLGSIMLKINAKETMRVAESLYTQGFISYPRTETNIFPQNMNLGELVEMQIQDNRWGAFAQTVLEEGPNPRQGKKTDEAHPPIHPTKYANNLQGNEAKVYEFIVRHFLACCSKDAQAHETIVDIDINGEKFEASGLRIIARNYLDVYPYENWKAKEIHPYEEGQRFQPTKIEKSSGHTAAPKPLTEADLIALMEKHGIGTDATHADHIETIKNRSYVGLDNTYFMPGELGLGLVDGYNSMGFPMSKPNLRAELEADLQRIVNGTRDAKDVLADQLRNYRNVFQRAVEQAAKIDIALAQYLNEDRQTQKKVCVCPSCGKDMVLRRKSNDAGYFVSCMGFPDCKKAIWFPYFVEHADVSEEMCNVCNSRPQKIKFRFKRGACPLFPDNYEGCVGGCDISFVDTLSICAISGLERTSNAPRTTSIGSNNRNPSNPGSNNRNPSNPSNPPNPNRRGGPSTGPSGGKSGTTAPAAFQNRMNSVHSDNPIVCKCNSDAIKITVRKDGPNQGRPFYKCGNNGSCDFFLWAEESNHPEPTRNQGPTHQTTFSGLERTSNAPRTTSIGSNNRNPSNPGSNNRNPSNPSNPPNPNRRGGPSTGPSGGKSGTTAPAAFQNRMNSVHSDNPIVCKCNSDAIQLTVRKDGPNQGRPFYKCGNNGSCDFFLWAEESNHPEPTRNQGPTHQTTFSGLERTSNAPRTTSIGSNNRNPSNPGSNNRNPSNPSNPPNPPEPTRNQGPTRQTTFSDFNDFNNAADGSGEVTCQCGQSARRCTVTKNSPNKGREFYGCPKPRPARCPFFQWAVSPEGGVNFGGGRGGGRGGGQRGRGGFGRGGGRRRISSSGE